MLAGKRSARGGECLSQVYGLDAIGIGKGEELGRERHNAALPLDLLENRRVHGLPADARACQGLDVVRWMLHCMCV